MSKLSPQAQAVREAAFEFYEDDTGAATGEQHAAEIAAAALRAAVQQTQFRQSGEHYVCDAADLIAIVEELEAGG